MRCPFCNSYNIKVYDGMHKNDTYIRYRRCKDCYKTFKTIERVSVHELKKVEEFNGKTSVNEGPEQSRAV